jgi:hypothetical protein
MINKNIKFSCLNNRSFRFYDLDVTLSLRENFENKTIVEYPTFYVITKEHSSMFDIIDSGKLFNKLFNKYYKYLFCDIA